jgi:transcriptional regulator with XRE-family HTH domain
MSENKIFSFGEYIRELRESAGLPLRKVAAQLDIDPSLLGKIERNLRPPNRELIRKLADIFGQNEDILITEFLSDQIAYIIIEEQGDIEVLKVAEKKIDYFKKQKDVQKA